MLGRRLEKPEAYSLNTLRNFSSRERRRCPEIIRRSRMALVGQAPGERRRSIDAGNLSPAVDDLWQE